MTARLRAFAAFWYDFVVGDDWRVAAGVMAGMLVTYLVSRTSMPAWWVLPVAVLAVATLSLRMAVRRR